MHIYKKICRLLESNKYKGVTPTSYYVSDSAKKFIKGLEVNRVTHGYIEISGNMYVASGVSFEYKDELYRMCLLTDKDVLLDNNQYSSLAYQLECFLPLADFWYKKYYPVYL